MWSIDAPPLGGENGAMVKKFSKHAPEQIVRKLDKARELRESGSTTAERVKLFVCGGVTCTCRSGLGRRPPFG